MTRGDSIPRYTYAMDFNSLDEPSPLTDFWQMNDGLDSEDAAVIASLATQALQSKMGYEYEDSMGVNEPAEVANYTESRSSPQSQYSAIGQEEPAESFRGLMEDHDRGAQFSGADVTTDYDMEPPRGRISDTVAGFQEQAFMRDSNLHDPLYSLLNESAIDEPRGTMTASQVVNEVLRNNELAEAQRQMDLNMQALHSQAQLTPPDSESPSIGAEERDHRELEEDFLTDVDEQHDCEPEDGVMEDPLPDTEAQQQLMVESYERPTMDEDEMDKDEDENDNGSRQPSPSPAPRKAGRPRKGDTAVELPDLVPEESNIAETALREKIVVEEDVAVEQVVEDAVMEEAVADGAEINGAEETPAARRRGRPRKSEIPEPTPTSSAKRGPGRPPKLAAPEAASESTPATGKRGRPRKSEVEDQPQIHPEESDEPIDEAPPTTPAAGKRGRPRRSEVEDRPQMPTDKSSIPLEEAPVAAPAAGKRGRPRKSEMEGDSHEHADIPQEEATTTATAPGKRGRPRKSDVEYSLQMHTKESDIPLEAVATSAAGKRGRPRKSEVLEKLQAHTKEFDRPVEATPTATPAAGKRGRPRKSEAEDQSQVHTKAIDILAEEAPATRPATGKRGRPRKSEVEDKSQVHAEESEKPAEEAPTATVTTGKRGRPRRNTLVDGIQAPIDESQLPVVETSATRSLSKRGRPRKSEAVDTAPNSTDEQPLTATEATNSTPAPGRRGRPRKSGVISTQNLADERVLSATETAMSTPAQGKRGRPPKSDTIQVPTNEAQPSIVETPTATPATGKRGRPRKSDAVSAIAPETRAVPELQAESGISTTADVAPFTTETMERNKPFGQEALEEQHTSLFTAPAQKGDRGGRTATDLDTAAVVEEAEPQGLNSEHTEDVAEGMSLDEKVATMPVPDIWEIEVTPAKKRGRPKSSAMDKPLPMTFAPVTASAKKRGRPPKAPTTEESAETPEEPTQAEAEETEERIAKRRRTDSDVVMEGSIEDLIQDLLEDAVEDPTEEAQPEAREERPASVRKRRVSFAADTKVPKSLLPIKFMRRNSDSTGLKAGVFSNTQRIPRLGGRTDNSKENAGAKVPFKSTATQQTELFLSRLPKPTVESVFDGNKFGKRPKTYGRRPRK
ncbi:hypothetical protein MKX08_005187 [Trichoderma sp. CBMAI-0020]|nr:hypothetical protein MKX08_005187 [Trichoderma sp. CBMAI-0020]